VLDHVQERRPDDDIAARTPKRVDHADKAGGELLKKWSYLRAAQLAAEHCLARRINPVHLENVLRDIQTDRGNLFYGWLLIGGSKAPLCGTSRCRRRSRP
jgi:hypothetical protein